MAFFKHREEAVGVTCASAGDLPSWLVCCHRECHRNLNSCWQVSSSCGQAGEPWEVFFHSIASGHQNLWPLLVEVSGISRCPQAEELELGWELALCCPLGNPSLLCSSGGCKEPLLSLSSSWWPTWVDAANVGSPGVGAEFELSASLPRRLTKAEVGLPEMCESQQPLKGKRWAAGREEWCVYTLRSEACWDQSWLWCTAEGAPFIGEPSGDNTASSMETIFIICTYSGVFIPKVKKE